MEIRIEIKIKEGEERKRDKLILTIDQCLNGAVWEHSKEEGDKWLIRK